VGALIIVVTALGACSGTKTGGTPAARASEHAASTAPRASTPPTRPAPVPTPAPATTPAPVKPVPEYSFDGSVPPPPIVNTGHDYVAIVTSIAAYGSWLAAHHPDPALVSRIIAEGTKQHAGFASDLTILRDRHLRLIEERGGPNKFTVVSARSDAFSVRVVEDVRLQEIVDPAGKVTSIVRYTTPTTYLSLVVLVGGHWQEASDDEQQPPTIHL